MKQGRLATGTAALLLALLAHGLPASAHGGGRDRGLVSLSGLDLAAPAGQAIAKRRIAIAVHAACARNTAGFGDDALLECQGDAMADAREQLARLSASPHGIVVAGIR